MIKDALNFIADLGRKACDPKELPGLNPRFKTFVIDGKTQSIEVAPKPREHTVNQLADIIALANRFKGQDDSPVVWYDEQFVRLVIDDAEDRIECASFELIQSDVFAKVVSLRDQKPWLNQKEFIRLLKIELAGTLPPGILLDRIRKIKWETNATATGVVTRGGESLGREIASKVDATGEVPEEVRLEVPVYSSKGERETYAIQFAVEIDSPIQSFRYLPLPDEVERVQQFAVDSIAERLSVGLAEGVNFYYGSP